MTNSGSYVGVACPKCEYIRNAEEGGNDWECPSCGIVYAKFLKAVAAAAPVPQVPQAQESTEQVYESNPVSLQPKGWAIAAHLSFYFLYIIFPLIVWYAEKDNNELSVSSAKEALNYQICFMVIMFLGVFGIFISSGFIKILMIIFIGGLIFPVVAAVEVSRGVEYQYPLIHHFFK